MVFIIIIIEVSARISLSLNGRIINIRKDHRTDGVSVFLLLLHFLSSY